MKVRVYQKVTDALQDEDCLVIITLDVLDSSGEFENAGNSTNRVCVT